MTWLSKNLGWIITLAALLIGLAASWGRIAQICTAVERKADVADVNREMDQIHKDLARIEGKIDTLIIQRSK